MDTLLRTFYICTMNYNEETDLSKAECLLILNTPDESLGELIEKAYSLRTKYKGNRVSIQLLTNVRSGNCTQNCAYCAQSRDSEAPIEKYRSVSDEKLYGDNDLVSEFNLSRHCIGLSGMGPCRARHFGPNIRILHQDSLPCTLTAPEIRYSLCRRPRSVFQRTRKGSFQSRRFHLRVGLSYRRRPRTQRNV